jgi:hypothetical protein
MPRHFQYVPISGESARELSQVLANSIRTRIMSGKDVNDNPAPALSKNYARAKQRRGLPPIRNWVWSGVTLAALAPVMTQDGQIAVGFTSDRAARIAATLNHRCQQFGISPGDRQTMIDYLNRSRPKLVRAA